MNGSNKIGSNKRSGENSILLGSFQDTKKRGGVFNKNIHHIHYIHPVCCFQGNGIPSGSLEPSPRFKAIRENIEKYKHQKNLRILIEKLRELPEPKPRRWIPPEDQEKMLRRIYERGGEPGETGRVLILPYKKKRVGLRLWGQKKPGTRGVYR